MALYTPDVKQCSSCDDSLCGGFIGECGGVSVKLVVQPGTRITVSGLAAEATAGSVTLRWSYSGGRPAGAFFNVYRAEDGSPGYRRLNARRIPASSGLRFVDDSVEPGIRYRYKIGLIREGSETLFGPIEIATAERFSFGIWQSYPNPFNPSTAVRFSLSKDGPVVVRIFDASGQLVKTLLDEKRKSGFHTLYWNGTNDGGDTVPSEVYFLRVESGKEVAVRKLTLVR